ncbi:MAG: discoidin domain-containing protein, partial [Ilumatobacteraceae bacterium]
YSQASKEVISSSKLYDDIAVIQGDVTTIQGDITAVQSDLSLGKTPDAVASSNTIVTPEGTYTITASSSMITPQTRAPWHAFDRDSSKFWATNTEPYDQAGRFTTGASKGGFSGEWIQVEMPALTSVQYLMMDGRDQTIGQPPRDFVVLGSSNGTTYFVIKQFADLDCRGGPIWLPLENGASYTYYAIVTQRSWRSKPSDGARLAVTELCFTQKPDHVPLTKTVLDVTQKQREFEDLFGYFRHPPKMVTNPEYFLNVNKYELFDGPDSTNVLHMFDSNNASYWRSNADTFDLTSGLYQGVESIAGVTGAYWRMETLIPFTPKTFFLQPVDKSVSDDTTRRGLLRASPRDFKVLGSSDGANWVILFEVTGHDLDPADLYKPTYYELPNEQAFTHFAFVTTRTNHVSSVIPTPYNNYSFVNVNTFRFFGRASEVLRNVKIDRTDELIADFSNGVGV